MCFVLGVIAFVYYKKNEPETLVSVNCFNGGVYSNGACRCPSGYEGSTCETEMRSRFFGSYNVNESCTSGNYNYTFRITASSGGVTGVTLRNFAGVPGNFEAIVDGNSITIPIQTVNIEGIDFSIQGSGQISGNMLMLSYSNDRGVHSDACTGKCMRQ